jgi:hypothetical protein
MVTGDILLNEGLRSRQRAHKMSTSWFLCQNPSKIPLANLRALPGGKDLDGNQWYDPHWENLLQLRGLPPDSAEGLRLLKQSHLDDLWAEIRKRAREIKPQDALAAEGYPLADGHILPNVHPTISNHVGGNAIDCHIPWKPGAVVIKYLNGSLEKPVRNPWLVDDTHPIGTFTVHEGGLHDDAANCAIEYFGLCRPVMSEIWHFQLAANRRPLSVTQRMWRH